MTDCYLLFYIYINTLLFWSLWPIFMRVCFLTIITHQPEFVLISKNGPHAVILHNHPITTPLVDITVISLSLLVEVFVCQWPTPLFRTPITKTDPQLIMSFVCVQGQQWLHCPHVVYGGQVIASLSAVALGIRPGFGGFNYTVLAVVGTEGRDTQSW